MNGIRLPAFIKVPIPAREIHSGYLIDWQETVAVVKFLLTGNDEHLGKGTLQEDAASVDVIGTDADETESLSIVMDEFSGRDEDRNVSVELSSNSEQDE